MAPEPERRCQCKEPASHHQDIRPEPCQCTNLMTGEDFLCDACRWARDNTGGCSCHLSSDIEYGRRGEYAPEKPILIRGPSGMGKANGE